VCAKAGVKRVRLTHYIGLDKDADVIAEIRRGGFKGEAKRAKDGDKWEL
jgi:ribonuclease BN (tRNA processing enzyme)